MRMEIKIDKFTIHSDKYNMWITEMVNQKKKDGSMCEVDKRVSGYTANFRQLLESYMSYKLRGSEARTVKEVLQDFADAERDLQAIINKVDKYAVKREV